MLQKRRIIPALEPSHALAHVLKIAPTLPKSHRIVMNMCGRGDKDIFTVAETLGVDLTGLIKQKFDQLKHDNKKAVIPFITADYPNRDEFLRLLNELPAHGASMIEIGIPFSDPMADGEVIQKTSQQAIQQGFQLKNLLMDIKTFKANHPTTPIILMTYANPLIQFGIDQFLVESEASGVDGLLLVDVPPTNITL